MGKNNKPRSQQPLGSSIIKDRFSKKKPHRNADSFLHTSELNDGYDWGRLNLNSVTEQSQLDDFLATAELAGTEFTAEKLNIKILGNIGGSSAAPGVPDATELKKIAEAQEKYKENLRIPRRPMWHGGMSAEELQGLERQHFLEWRRSLAELQEREHITITPFEKNLDFWRQLWRVIERSDIVVQIVDSRNPLLFRCEDMEVYVKEVCKDKTNVILINKSDFLTEKQRKFWCDYFNSQNVKVFFWSAKLETEKLTADLSQNETSGSEPEADSLSDEEAEEELSGSVKSSGTELKKTSENSLNSPTLFSAEELVDQLKMLAPKQLVQGDVLTIGLVGYPNVGKSSTINAILHAKKCSVSATPGKTKHFQTIHVDPYTVLCDCPGLVMPSFITTKADMILNGILPIDQMRDHKPPINLLAHKIPRAVLEHIYSISIRKPKEGEDPHRPPTDLELLNAYGAMRGFMTQSGVPDNPRASRILLKDFVNGKLLYCEAPPGVSSEEYGCSQSVPTTRSDHVPSQYIDELKETELAVDSSASARLDSEFFKKNNVILFRNGKAIPVSTDGKSSKKHFNKNKKEKTRRLFAHLDKHDAY